MPMSKIPIAQNFASLRVVGCGLRVVGCGLRVTGYGLRVTVLLNRVHRCALGGCFHVGTGLGLSSKGYKVTIALTLKPTFYYRQLNNS
jgi:hypothetical protein